jgi:hypothetical protein
MDGGVSLSFFFVVTAFCLECLFKANENKSHCYLGCVEGISNLTFIWYNCHESVLHTL